jgi:hypothetical protein
LAVILGKLAVVLAANSNCPNPHLLLNLSTGAERQHWSKILLQVADLMEDTLSNGSLKKSPLKGQFLLFDSLSLD